MTPSALSNERLDEIETWALSEQMECAEDDMPVSAQYFADVAALITELLSYRSEGVQPAVYIGANDVTAYVTDDMVDTVRAAFDALPNPPFGEKVLPLYLSPSTIEGWQPIETAPTAGKAFLVWCPDRHNTYLVIARFGVLEHFGPGSDPLRETPTLWQPLPEPPRALNPRDGGGQ